MKNGKNVWLLMVCQALTMSIPSFMVFLASIIGQTLAPDPGYATLPVGAFLLGSALGTLPVILAMRRWGRKAIFIMCSLIAGIGGLLAIAALMKSHFPLFVAAGMVLGFGLAAGQQYRFAAMESVDAPDMPKAASRVLIGGIIAAFLGPEIAIRGESLLGTPYVGSFALLLVVIAMATLVLLFFVEPQSANQSAQGEARPWGNILSQPVIWVAVLSGLTAFAVMSTVMTATPLHMHFENGHSLVDTKWVIQSHIVAMFLPSLVVPMIVSRIGEVGLIGLGVGAFVASLAVIFSDYEFINYWLSLVLLGLGWNFLFIGGTTLLPQGYRDSERFKVQAFNDFTIFGVQSTGALMAGWLLARFGWQYLLLGMLPILAMLVLTVVYWRTARASVVSA
ncbi:MAG TPA: MFS transporter [Porticoccaceae bacterium]|nr:MFS transporter [Porticoccaceae bacterium]HCO60288.1 MFS transporter [Porticoccaceae bacterium]